MPDLERFVVEPLVQGDQTVLFLKGELVDSAAPVLAKVLDQHRDANLLLDVSELERVDSAGVAVILEARQAGAGELVLRGANPAVRKIFSISLARMGELDETTDAAFWDPITQAGEAALRFKHQLHELAIQAGDMCYWLLVSPLKGKPLRLAAAVRQAGLVGADAVPIVCLISLLVGLIMAMQAAQQLRQFGASIFVADLVGISVTRELGPLITAIVVAGRSGSAIAAELGTMRVSEEIDALRTMGLNPTRYLIVPRLLALLVAMPCLVMIADLVAITGGLLIAVFNLGIGANTYINQTVQALFLSDIVTGLIKAVVFGGVIANVAVFAGMHVHGGAESVGRATTGAVVASIMFVVIADALFTTLFYAFSR